MKKALVVLLIFAGIAGPRAQAGGLGAIIHPIAPPAAEEAAPIMGLTPVQRDLVHVLLINGTDPGNLFNFHGINRYVQELGFRNASYFQFWEHSAIRKQLDAIRAGNPQARIVIVGFSAGSMAAMKAVEAEQGPQRIDLLIYVAGHLAGIETTSRPPQVDRLVDVRARGPVLNLIPFGLTIDGACNYDLGNVLHARVPMNRQFQRILAKELFEVACSPR